MPTHLLHEDNDQNKMIFPDLDEFILPEAQNEYVGKSIMLGEVRQ